MKKLKRTLSVASKGVLIGLAVACLSVGSLPQSASAAGCRFINESLINGAGPDYFYSPTYTVPSNSSCNDINIAEISYLVDGSIDCGMFRVRFFPSGGGSYTNNYQHACSDYFNRPLRPIATNVANGTTYRIESTYRFFVDIYD